MRLLPLALAALLLPGVAAAQRPTAQAAERARLMERIDLTPAQQVRLDSLWAAHDREMAPVRERMRAAPGDTALLRVRETMHASMMARVRSELTPEQQVVFDRNRAALEERRRARQGAARPPG